MDLTIIPYGNAMIDTDKKTVECQHGLGECDANTYELCVIQSYPDPQLYVPFLTCMADKLTPGFRKDVFPPDDFQACAKENHMFWPSIAGCHCCHGYEVLAKAAQETPDHDYVPYVEINGNVMDSEADFMGTICAAFQAQGGSIAECDAHLERMSQQEHATTRITTTCPVAPTLVITSSDTTKIV
jgi:Gamma interferon inducible lysosomal thiol reductase (GILT)